MTTPPTATSSAPKGDRIAKLLARAGIASRREIERMIEEGRIALDGVVLDTPATILSSLRGVTVDGDPVAPPDAARLFLYHKPTGLLVTERDPAGRPTIYDRLPQDLPRTVPVGRLDLNTEGLLLLTTDGGLKRQLELPATGVERTYRARAYGEVTQTMLEDLSEGIEIEGIRYGPIDANLERRTGANTWIEMTLTEGKNREVRRVLEHLGLQVGRLIRTRYGPFVLGDLPPGEVGEVKQHDLVAFSKTLAGPRRAKGADLQSLVEVEARPKAPKAAAPAPERSPRTSPARASSPRDAEPPRATSPWPSPARPAAPKPATGGWGSRTRPSRPAEPAEARPVRGPFRSTDAGPRDAAPPARFTPADRTTRPSSPRVGFGARPHDADRDRPERSPRPTDDRARPAAFGRSPDQRADRAPRPDRDDRSPRAFSPRAGGPRPERNARPGDDRADGNRSPDQRADRSPRPDRDDRAPRAYSPRASGPRPSDDRARPAGVGRSPDQRADRSPRADREDRTHRTFSPRPGGTRPERGDDRPARGFTPRAAGPRTSDQHRVRPARTESDPRARSATPDRGDHPAKPGKGPSGGRGHPPRAPKGAPKGGPKAPGRGKR